MMNKTSTFIVIFSLALLAIWALVSCNSNNEILDKSVVDDSSGMLFKEYYVLDTSICQIVPGVLSLPPVKLLLPDDQKAVKKVYVYKNFADSCSLIIHEGTIYEDIEEEFNFSNFSNFAQKIGPCPGSCINVFMVDRYFDKRMNENAIKLYFPSGRLVTIFYDKRGRVSTATGIRAGYI